MACQQLFIPFWITNAKCHYWFDYSNANYYIYLGWFNTTCVDSFAYLGLFTLFPGIVAKTKSFKQYFMLKLNLFIISSSNHSHNVILPQRAAPDLHTKVHSANKLNTCVFVFFKVFYLFGFFLNKAQYRFKAKLRNTGKYQSNHVWDTRWTGKQIKSNQSYNPALRQRRHMMAVIWGNNNDIKGLCQQLLWGK